jgi:hypothetical protein
MGRKTLWFSVKSTFNAERWAETSQRDMGTEKGEVDCLNSVESVLELHLSNATLSKIVKGTVIRLAPLMRPEWNTSPFEIRSKCKFSQHDIPIMTQTMPLSTPVRNWTKIWIIPANKAAKGPSRHSSWPSFWVEDFTILKFQSRLHTINFESGECNFADIFLSERNDNEFFAFSRYSRNMSIKKLRKSAKLTRNARCQTTGFP